MKRVRDADSGQPSSGKEPVFAESASKQSCTPENCNHVLPRYVRVNPRRCLGTSSRDELAEAVSAALGGVAVTPVEWLSPWFNVYSCHSDTQVGRSSGFNQGELYGMDACSVAAVCCLDPRPGDKVLDLCCAPGGKLCAIADAILPNGIVVGVDIAKHRLGTCHATIEKYGVNNALLSLDDGTTWNPLVDVNWFASRKTATRQKQSTDERVVAEECPGNFDKVLVDAQCSHDGVAKFNDKLNLRRTSDRMPLLPDENRLAELQTALLKNGFRCLCDGGTLVYSTCSISKAQNEEIIDSFLKDNQEAVLDPLPLQPTVLAASRAESDRTWRFAPTQPSYLETLRPLGSGGLYCTARFNPSASETNGFFVARIRRQNKCA